MKPTPPAGRGPRPVALAGEGVAIARSQPVATVVTALVVAAVCAVILLTTGQSAAAEARVVARIDSAGTRTLVLSDPNGQAVINADSVAAVRALSGVRWVIGLTGVSDVRNTALGDAGRPVAARTIYGDLPTEINLNIGPPPPGTALAGQAALDQLGATHPAAGIAGTTYDTAVIGIFHAAEPLAFLNTSILIASTLDDPADEALPGTRPSTQGTLSELYVMVDRVDDVERITRAAPTVLRADNPNAVLVTTPQQLVDLREVISSELGDSSRRAMLLVLAVGLVIVALTLAGAVSQRRRDFGRRRALGASRTAIVALVITHTAVGALIGLLIGGTAGVLGVWRLAGSLPTVPFIAGVAALTLLTALLAAIPPATLAALREPVRILRVP